MPFERIPKNRLKDFARIQDKRFRRESGTFLTEGVHLLEEFLKSGLAAEWIVIDTEFEDSFPQLARTLHSRFGAVTCVASKIEFKRISETEHAQGVAVSVRKSSPKPPVEQPRMILALDQISDPGNLGTILRSADWFGVNSVFLSDSCVELFNPKVVRATMGSIFRLNGIENSDLKYQVPNWKRQGYSVFGTSSDESAESLPVPIRHRSVLVIGNESRGLSPELALFCDRQIRIPKLGHGDSLNVAVAASILLYEFTKP